MFNRRTGISAVLLATLIALAATDRANAALVRASALSPSAEKGGQAVVVWESDISERAAVSADATAAAGASQGEPVDRDHNSRRPFVQILSCLPTPGGGMGAIPSGNADGGNPVSAAPLGIASRLPQCTIIGWLPDDMGPSFANPPPWTPLKPPRL